MRINIIFIFIIFMIATAKANYNHCNTLGGWYFYCTDGEKEEQKTPDQPKEQNQDKSDEWYLNEIKKMTRNVDVKKAKAIINPTTKNVRDYMAYQRQVLDKASTFADKWQRVLWQDPSLDYSLERPISKIGKETYLDNKKMIKNNLFLELAKRYAVLFVFKASCPYSQKIAVVLKMLEEKGFNITPISIDGSDFEGLFPNSPTKYDRGELRKLGIDTSVVPSIHLFDSKTNQVITLGFGFLSLDEIEERIYMLTSKKVGEDY